MTIRRLNARWIARADCSRHKFGAAGRCVFCHCRGGDEGVRRLDSRWIAAGRRRIIARGLRDEGWTFKRIAAELGVSAEQARRDCR